jgi:lipoprotein-anchoring transpeptidase ErfK/SrfK
VPGQEEPSRPRRRGAAFRVGVAAAVVAAVAILAGTAGLAVSAASRSDHRPAARRPSGQRQQAAGPLRVVAVSPSDGTARLSGAASVQIDFSAPVGRNSADPRLSPSVPGQWQVSGSTLMFNPDTPLAPSTRYTLRIPAGPPGIMSASGSLLAKPVTTHFRTAAYSQLRLAELLSNLGYLPLAWQPGAGGRLSSDPTRGGEMSQQEQAYSPPAGSFTWQAGYPASLRSQWLPDRPNPLVRGAVMAFKAQHRMAINADTNGKFWDKLFAAADAGQRNKFGYTYAIASKGSPETLTIWHDGRVVLRSLANTGIPVAPTASGTFPVYQRYRYQVMRGTNPDGSHYADPVTFVAYFDGGDAVHYFPRGSYGSPQSLGCVELPYSEAERAWPYLTYGSLVTVSS